MFLVTSELNIDAPAQTVFDIITDFESYQRWNPWIIRASGTAQEGGLVRVTSLVGGRPLKVRHRVLASRPGREFRWCDLGWFTALAYGERARFLEPRAGGGATYRVELKITGVASRLVESRLARSLTGGVESEAEALKRRAEALHRGRA
jgi:hypothetical protein